MLKEGGGFIASPSQRRDYDTTIRAPLRHFTYPVLLPCGLYLRSIGPGKGRAAGKERRLSPVLCIETMSAHEPPERPFILSADDR